MNYVALELGRFGRKFTVWKEFSTCGLLVLAAGPMRPARSVVRYLIFLARMLIYGAIWQMM